MSEQDSELLKWLREARRKNAPFDASKLPTWPPGPPSLPISIVRERVTQFNEDYATLAAFACYVTGAKLKELCGMHLIAYILRQEVELADEPE